MPMHCYDSFRTTETCSQSLLRFPRRQETHAPYPVGFLPRVSRARGCERGLQNLRQGRITRAEIKTTIMKVYKERRFLARSLRDVSEALTTLVFILLHNGESYSSLSCCADLARLFVSFSAFPSTAICVPCQYWVSNTL